jgi:hypothetical protein
LLSCYVLLNLGLAQPEHAPELFDWRLIVEQLADLFQREAEITEGEHAVETSQLSDLIPSVAGLRVDSSGLDQAGRHSGEASGARPA